jgi:hypothetical protein
MLSFKDLYRFLGRMAKVSLDEADIGYLEHFVELKPPWEELLVLAEMNGVAGFFFRHLVCEYGSELPDSVNKKATSHYQETVSANQAMLAALARVAERLKKANLTILALQGVTLLNLYQDPGLRPLGDIDLLVRPGSDKERLLRLLSELGFRPSTPHYPDLVEKDSVRFDIHTHPLGTERIASREFVFPGNIADIWAHAEPMGTVATSVLVPANADNIILLAAHALKHGYRRIIWLADVYLYLQHLQSIDPSLVKLHRRAKLWHQEKSLGYAIELATRVCCEDRKRRRLVRLYPSKLSTLEERMITIKATGGYAELLPHLLWLQNIESLPKKLRFVRENLFPRPSVLHQIARDRNVGHAELMIPFQILRGIQLLADIILLRR